MASRGDHRPLYGRHTEHRAGAVPVAVLLAAAMREGQPIRLAWPSAAPTATSDEFPTAELPAIPRAAIHPDGGRNR
jgi:hypothetical protein